MGLTDCLVDLDGSLLRMIETSFIEEYMLDSNTKLNSFKDDPRNSDQVLRYRFTNSSVHENVYNLMLEDHREVAHAFLGAYLEPFLADNPALFDRAVFHFMRSGNAAKKVEYLCKAAEVSRIAGNFRDVYFYFGELVKLTSGLKAIELLEFCCTPFKPHVEDTGHEFKKPAMQRARVARRINEFPAFVCLSRRWLTGTDFVTEIRPILNEISVENICRWIGEMGLILFKYDYFYFYYNIIISF